MLQAQALRDVLQWGLGLIAEEIGNTQVETFPNVALQWGLGLIAEEMLKREPRVRQKVMLQWGLGLIAEEIGLRYAETGTVKMLQWGLGLIAEEIRDPALAARTVRHASMGPRPDSRGDDYASVIVPTGWTVLQWGLGLIAEEMAVAASRSARGC